MKPTTVTEQACQFLLTAPNAVRTHGKASLRVDGNQFVMSAPNTPDHVLNVGMTDAKRLDAHWQQFCAARA